MTEDSASSYMMRMLIAGTTALLLCALFDYYQLQVWLYRKFETQNQDEIYGAAWPRKFTIDFLWEVGLEKRPPGPASSSPPPPPTHTPCD